MNEFEIGPIRPPSESSSLLIRVTRGCHWNKCYFCGLYKSMKFSMRPIEEIISDIKAQSEQHSGQQYKKYVNGQSIKYTVTPTLGMTQKNQPKIKYTLDFDVTPHQLRHTYITNLLYAGVDPKTVQYLAGHENSKTTMDIYAKVKYNKPEELFGVVNSAFHQTVID